MSKEEIGEFFFTQARRLPHATGIAGNRFYGMIAMMPPRDSLAYRGYEVGVVRGKKG